MVLAGGYGTRLAPVLDGLPKGLAPIRGKPFLDLLVEFLSRQGIAKVVFCVGHLREAVMARYARWPGVQTSFAVEQEPLGTGGAVNHALPLVSSDRFYVLNGDSYCDIELAPLLRFHLDRGALATLVAAHLPGREDIGQVRLDAAGKVTSFLEKVPRQDARRAFMNAGIYVLERAAFDGVPEARLSLENELLPGWVSQGRCYGFVTTAEVVDIGTPDRYARAQKRL